MSEKNQQADRRAYWTEQMEAAFDFMREIDDYPVRECGEEVVSLREEVATAGVEVAFSEKPHAHGGARMFVLRKGIVGDFLACAGEMNERGWTLKVEDGFRTMEMQRLLALQENTFDVVLRRIVWECEGEAPAPELVRKRLSVLIAASPKLGTHMSASAVDVSVLHRDSRREVDRGGPYIELSEKTPMDSPFISKPARQNRREITGLMAAHGFVAYPFEFWHYSKGDAYDEFLNKSGRPARYGPVEVEVSDGSVSPIENAREPLTSREDMEAMIAKALKNLSMA